MKGVPQWFPALGHVQPKFLRLAGEAIEAARPKQIALSGPAGFLGSRVLACILDAHERRIERGLGGAVGVEA